MTEDTIQFRAGVTVELLDAMASDPAVARTARVSTGGGDALFAVEDTRRDAGLINYLMKNRHGSPFEACVFRFHVEAPIFVFRELMRHRIASYNEVSGRYRELEPVFYIPAADRRLRQEGAAGHYQMVKSTSEDWLLVCDVQEDIARTAWDGYRRQLDAGIAREVARMGLPLSIYSSLAMTINARSLMNLLSLRVNSEVARFPSFPMWEIEMVAKQMETQFAAYMPVTHRAFVDNGRVAP